MLQVLQNLGNGETSLVDVPAPKREIGHVLIKTSKSLVSVGTERMIVDFGKANWIDKVKSQPDKVKTVFEKFKTDGLSATYDAVKSKLDEPVPLGYCNVGRVIDGSDTGFEKNVRIVSNGYHAEVVRVPKNLVAQIPDEVDDETAAFTVLGAIALQGIRLVNPTVGETVVVIGLGLIGLLTVQILKANGCRVLGIDFDSTKCELAKQFGAEIVDLSKDQNPLDVAHAYSRGRGVDAVIITASSESNDIVHQAATMSRKRGRIVLVGVVGLQLSRADFYEKELTLQVSCSYGPGRYDQNYENKGMDYPIGFVRWTEKRNFEAVLDLMASGSIDVKPLISHRFQIDDALMAYEKLANKSSLGIMLDYKTTLREAHEVDTVKLSKKSTDQALKKNIAFIGAGNYASRVLIPAFKHAGARLTALVTSQGISSVYHGKKNGFYVASTEIDKAFTNEVHGVVIATRHDMHSSQIIQALEKGKHVFVEKPLAITTEQVNQISKSHKNSNSILMVGYNRRFSPHIKKMKNLIDAKDEPKVFIFTMNAGAISKEHWTQDKKIGGGRIIGEACHYIDLMRYLTGSKIKNYNAVKIGKNDSNEITEDKAIITITFEDGSIGSIHYLANGGKSFPKERIEVFCAGSVLQLDNFKKLHGYGWNGFNKMNLWSQDKGQQNCVNEFMKSIQSEQKPPIPHDEIFEVARVSIDIAKSLSD